MRTSLSFLALLLLGIPALAAPPPGITVAEVHFDEGTIIFDPFVSSSFISLTMTGPEETCLEENFPNGERPYIKVTDQNGERRPDGVYTYELRVTPKFTSSDIARRKEERTVDPGSSFKQLSEITRQEALIQDGSFTILEGRIVDPTVSEKSFGKGQDGTGNAPKVNIADGPLTLAPTKDFVINDDLIVDGSACIGFDCVNGESFSFDTIRLKENNLRIKFDDTSVAASFPRTDWQLTANASANGGASKFSIDDISGSRTPFTVEANARSHSLYVDDGGRIGNRTSTPSTEIHTIDGDTPTLRLQQDGSSGFAPQTWDVAGNETNFFIRDVSNGSTLPFRIRPGASTNAIFVDSNDEIGFGTASPESDIHVTDANGDGNAEVQVETGSAAWKFRANDANDQFNIIDDNGGTTPFRIAAGALSNLLEIGVDANNRVEINGQLFISGSQVTPDYVFEADYELESIEEHAALMWKHKHLPAMLPATLDADGKTLIDVGHRSQAVLEELEKAHIYIEQLHGTIGELTGAMGELTGTMEEMRQRLEKIENGQ